MIIKFKPTTPDWLYFKAKITIDNLAEIQQELFNLFSTITNLDINTASSSFNLTTDILIIKKTCPNLVGLLSSVNLIDHLGGVAFISARKDAEFPIHVDGDVDFALNIPVLNCKNSYTAWYLSEIGNIKTKAEHYGVVDDFSNSVALICDPQYATEIERIDADIPHWINTNIPHKPIVLGDGFRINSSLRFNPVILQNNQPPKDLIM